MQLPPGPRFTLPYLLKYIRNPLGVSRGAFEKWGDPHLTRAFGTRLLVTADPKLIRAILDVNPDHYEPFGVKTMAPVIGKSSLIMLGGERHRAARKLQTPPFHGSRMRAYAGLMQRIARDEAAAWRAGEPFAMQESTQSISLRVILSAVLGLDGDPRAAEVERRLVALIGVLRPELLMFGWLQHGWYPPWRRYLKYRAPVEELMLSEVSARRAVAGERSDILSLLLTARYEDGAPMEDLEVYESMMTLVVAGHETTALAMAWALWLLHRHPETLARVQEEVKGVDDPEKLAALPYLDAVCQETLRLRPIAPGIVRILNRPTKIGDWELPAGMGVNPSMIALHHRADLYPEPDAFRPQRFLERTFAPHEFMPFGAGHRKCLGAAFAMFEMKIVLGTLLQAKTLRLTDDADVPMVPRNTVLGPARPLRFVA
jgi:cytochrome P450